MKQDLIQVDGKFYKKCKIVMLPVLNKGSIYKRASGKLFITNRTYVGNQHLYILSDDEIMIGDYYHAIGLIIKYIAGEEKYKRYCPKVISATDSSLNLPRPSDSFIKKYCELGGIDEVLVEYNGYNDLYILKKEDFKYTLKIAPDNTITIKPVSIIKPILYTEFEVLTLLAKHMVGIQCGDKSNAFEDWWNENKKK